MDWLTFTLMFIIVPALLLIYLIEQRSRRRAIRRWRADGEARVMARHIITYNGGTR